MVKNADAYNAVSEVSCKGAKEAEGEVLGALGAAAPISWF